MGFCSNCGVPKANNVLICWRCNNFDSNASGYKEYFEQVDRERKREAEYIESLPAIKRLIYQTSIGFILFFVFTVISCTALAGSIIFVFTTSTTIKNILGQWDGFFGLIIGISSAIFLLLRMIRWSREK